MTGQQFEDYVSNLFSHLGYIVKITGGLEDMGCDLVVEKDNIKTAVQAKRWKKFRRQKNPNRWSTESNGFDNFHPRPRSCQ